MQTQSEPAAPPASEEQRLARARRRVEALKGFYIHLFVFVLVLAALTIINAAAGGPWWVLWVLLGWGIGMLAHGLTVFGQSSRVIADWEERKLRQLLDER
jgi:fatty acid desaturase